MTKKDAIVTRILSQIQTGMLMPGDKLPSLRQIADRNHVSLYTAIGAYEELVAMGVIENLPKVGSFVIDSGSDVSQLLKMRNISIPARQKLETSENVQYYERYTENLLASRHTSVTQFLQERIGEDFYEDGAYRALREVVRKVPEKKKWQYFLEERSRLISGLAQLMLAQKCYFMRDSMLLFRNPMEALLLSVFALRATAEDPDMVLAIESPCSRLFRISAYMLNVKYVEIPSDWRTGLRVDALETEIRSGKRFMGLLCQPRHADPTGASMPAEAKEQLIALCNQHGIPIIEYDWLGGLYLGEYPDPPIKSLDHESVIYISDLSGVLGYDLPLVYMESGKYAAQIASLQTFCRAFSATNEGVAIAAGMLGKELPNNAKTLTASIRSATETFVRELRAAVPPSVRVYGGDTGPYLWIELPDGTDAEEFSRFAAENRVYTAPGQMFSALPDAARCIRVNCCTHRQSKDVASDAEILGKIISAYLSNPC